MSTKMDGKSEICSCAKGDLSPRYSLKSESMENDI